MRMIGTRQRGMTLIELIIGMVAGVAIAMVVYMLFVPVDNVLFTFWRRSGITEGSSAISRMLQEIERSKGNGYITTYATDHFVFTDIDNQSVDFQKTGTDVTRNGVVLMRNVQSLLFEYLNQGGTTAGAAGQIRTVRVTCVVTSGNQTIRLQSVARIRNGTT